ncbi:MAG: CPBP family intramembrane metalloprotease [Oribacterium sp.]|nr:CPBP family intramembrane metalloprotease [Oribacterium sp.]
MKSQNKTNTVLSGLIILIIYLFIQFVSGMIGGILALLYTAAKTGGNFDYMKVVAESQPVVLLVSEIISIAVFGIWYRSKYVKENGENHGKSGLKKILNLRTMSLIVCLTVVTYSIALLISIIVSFFSPASEEIFNSIMSLAIGDNTIIGYLGIILLAPIAEELAFRGVLLKKSRMNFGIIGCIVLNTVVFSISHLNPLQSIYVIPIGIMLTFLAYKYDSVLPSIIAHILNNSLGVLIPLLLHRELRITEIMVEIILFSIPIYFLNREDKELEPAVENK